MNYRLAESMLLIVGTFLSGHTNSEDFYNQQIFYCLTKIRLNMFVKM